MKLRLPIAILMALLLNLFPSAWLRAQAPVHAPDHFLPDDDTIGLAAGIQETPAIAWGLDSFLAVWSDSRAAPGQNSFLDSETAFDIYGMRFDAAGNSLEQVPFVITQGRAAQTNPKVVWNGSLWLVVYETFDVNGIGTGDAHALEGVRMAPDGQLLDVVPISIYRAPTSSGLLWTVASDGEVWTVVYENSTGGDSDIMAVRISQNGDILDQAPRLIFLTVDDLYFNLRLAHAAGVYMLVWDSSLGPEFVRFDRDLNPLDTTPRGLPLTYQGPPYLDANDTEFFLVWPQRQPNFVKALVGSPVSTSGVVQNPAGYNISLNNEPSQFQSVGVDWDGVNWRISWSHGGLSVARVTPSGQVLDPGGIAFPSLGNGAAAANPTGDLGVAWTAHNLSLYEGADVMGASISASNVASAPIPLSVSSPRQTHVDVATSGSGYMMVLHSDISGLNRIVAQPLDGSGNPLTSQPVLLESSSSTYTPTPLGIAWNGSLYLAVWTDSSSGIFGRRIQPDGTLVDPAPFPIMADAFDAAVAASGDLFLVVGIITDPIYEHRRYPFGARIQGSDGTVLDTPPVQIGGTYASTPAVAAVGGRWLVAWTKFDTHDRPIATARANFFNDDGSVGMPFTLFPSHMSTFSRTFRPGLASKADGVLWVQSVRPTSLERDLVGRLIHADGTMQPVFDVAIEPHHQFEPKVAWDGSQFVVVYRDQRHRTSIPDPIDNRSDLYASRVTGSGALLDPKGFAFAVSPKSEAYPSVAAANGVTLIAGSVVRNEAPYAAMRVGYDLLGEGGNNWPVAVITSSTSGGDIPLDVNFSSTGSHDPDGTISTYLWDFGDGSTAAVPNPFHTFVTPGDHVVSLTVTDNLGASTTSTTYVDVTPVNQPPVAVITARVWYTPTAPADLVFTNAGSYDPDGALGNRLWTFSDGGYAPGSPAFYTFEFPGIYQVTLTVWDDRGATGSASMAVYVGTTPMPGDVNGNGLANIFDIQAAAESWNTRLGQPGYNPIVDRNNDQHITMDEVMWVVAQW